jgi:hypothetical protein
MPPEDSWRPPSRPGVTRHRRRSFHRDRKSKTRVLLWGKAPTTGKLEVTHSGTSPRKLANLAVRKGKVFTEKVRLKRTRASKLKAEVKGAESLEWKLR